MTFFTVGSIELLTSGQVRNQVGIGDDVELFGKFGKQTLGETSNLSPVALLLNHLPGLLKAGQDLRIRIELPVLLQQQPAELQHFLVLEIAHNLAGLDGRRVIRSQILKKKNEPLGFKTVGIFRNQDVR